MWSLEHRAFIEEMPMPVPMNGLSPNQALRLELVRLYEARNAMGSTESVEEFVSRRMKVVQGEPEPSPELARLRAQVQGLRATLEMVMKPGTTIRIVRGCFVLERSEGAADAPADLLAALGLASEGRLTNHEDVSPGRAA